MGWCVVVGVVDAWAGGFVGGWRVGTFDCLSSFIDLMAKCVCVCLCVCVQSCVIDVAAFHEQSVSW